MRSMLFVPGDSPRKMEKALSSGADALILDLEDSVSQSGKSEARKLTAQFLADTAGSADTPALMVRVNALDTGMTVEDVDAVISAKPQAIVLPKAEGGATVQELHVAMSVAEARAGIADGTTDIHAIATETARGIFTLGTYGHCSTRLKGLAWGAEDLSADIGAETNRTADGATEPFRFARSMLLFGAADAGVAAIDTVHVNFRNLDDLRAECVEARRDGFTAKMAIHPAQVPIINEVFTPSEEDIAFARQVVQAFAQDESVGVVAIDGRMYDRPHLRRAERLLARARP
ncbi:HpcH/HpaI aldolase/citrate lyase family protein [Tepidamorphus sp. 3E244]|uniref:HpcH/HpaI aldolase/citrate lyase family protein n=1 Tax=Tepidamorphus sp. 3E244 TaxID=3385498 RepID=UPI0038FBEC54